MLYLSVSICFMLLITFQESAQPNLAQLSSVPLTSAEFVKCRPLFKQNLTPQLCEFVEVRAVVDEKSCHAMNFDIDQIFRTALIMLMVLPIIIQQVLWDLRLVNLTQIWVYFAYL